MQRTIKRKDEDQGGTSKQQKVVAEAEESALVQAKKNGKKGANKNDIIEQLVQVLTRLVLTNSNDLRELTGMLLTTHLVPASFSLAAHALEAGKQYQEMVQEQKKEKGTAKGSSDSQPVEGEDLMDTSTAPSNLGAPHIFIAMIAIQAMLNDSSLVNMENEKSSLLASWKKHIEGKSEEEIHGMIKIFRVRKPQKQSKQKGMSSDYTKVTLCLDPCLEIPIMAMLKKAGAIRKSGKAPRGFLEREASTLLNRMSKNNGS